MAMWTRSHALCRRCGGTGGRARQRPPARQRSFPFSSFASQSSGGRPPPAVRHPILTPRPFPPSRLALPGYGLKGLFNLDFWQWEARRPLADFFPIFCRSPAGMAWFAVCAQRGAGCAPAGGRPPIGLIFGKRVGAGRAPACGRGGPSRAGAARWPHAGVRWCTARPSRTNPVLMRILFMQALTSDRFDGFGGARDPAKRALRWPRAATAAEA